MDKRNSPFKAIFTSNSPADTNSILSLNAFSEVVNISRKQSPKSVHSRHQNPASNYAQRVTGGHASTSSSLADRASTLQVSKQCAANIKNYASNSSLKEDSMRFAYREQDSEFSKECVQEFLGKMQESSIEIKQESHWAEEPRLIDSAVKAFTHHKLNDERKKIQEEKVRIQHEKSELDRKRMEIENLLKQYYQLKQASQIHDSIRSATPLKNDICNRTPSTMIRHSEKNYDSQCLSSRESFREYEDVISNHNKQIRLEKDIQKLEQSKQKAKQRKARLALHLQNLWINIIKNHNQSNILKARFAQDFFKRLKKIRGVHKLAQVTQSIMKPATLAIFSKAFAFSKVKKAVEYDNRSKIALVRKSVVIKVIKKQGRQSSVQRRHANPNSSRVCQTESSRVQKFNEANYTDVISRSSETSEFDRLTFQSSGASTHRVTNNPVNSNKVAEIDMIIKSQLIRSRQQKALKQLNESPRKHFVKNTLCNGSQTSRANQGIPVVTVPTSKAYVANCLTERKSESKQPMNVFAAVSTPSTSRLVNSKVTSKKITLCRK